MSATAQSVSRILSEKFPPNGKGVRPYAVRKDNYRIVVFSSTHSLKPADEFLKSRGFSTQWVGTDYLLVHRGR